MQIASKHNMLSRTHSAARYGTAAASSRASSAPSSTPFSAAAALSCRRAAGRGSNTSQHTENVKAEA